MEKLVTKNKNMFLMFGMKTMKDYIITCTWKCAVLLINNILKNYGLSPSHYLSTPSLSWNAMLKMTKVELELIPDPDMYIFLKKGSRVEISYISNRYSKVNNKYLKSYDPKQESKHIIT